MVENLEKLEEEEEENKYIINSQRIIYFIMFSFKDKNNKEIYSMVMFCVALSRAAYDNPIKSLHNLCVLFNMKYFRRLLKYIDTLNPRENFLLVDNFKGDSCPPVAELKNKYKGKINYKQIAGLINTAADRISKKGTKEKNARNSQFTHEIHQGILGPTFYKNTCIFESEEIISTTPSKIRSVFICTINDLNCYVVYHSDYNIIYVIFRGTLSVKSAIEDIMVMRRKVKPPLYDENDIHGRVHLGFLETIDQAFHRICYFIAKFQQEASISCKIVTTGHSLGGALTTIFAYFYSQYYNHIKNLCEKMKCPAPDQKIHCVAVSPPKVGGEKFSNSYTIAIDNNKIEHINMFNRKDPVPKVPTRGMGTYSKWSRPGNNYNIICGNSSVSPVHTNTRYKGDLKCKGIGSQVKGFNIPTLNAHLYMYFINFTSNMRSALQTRPEKKYIRFIYWNGNSWKTLFIDNWRCNHVLNYVNYQNEIENGFASATPTIIFKAQNEAKPVIANTDDGKSNPNESVRYRKYNRNCKEREQKRNTASITERSRRKMGGASKNKKKRTKKKARRRRRKKGKSRKTRRRR